MGISSAASPSSDEVVGVILSLGEEMTQNGGSDDILDLDGVFSEEDFPLACDEGLENFLGDLPNDTGTDFFSVSFSHEQLFYFRCQSNANT